MRLSSLFSAALLAALGLAGCTAKTDVEPEAPCGAYATVRLCHGKTLVCPTEHTTLELADGTRLSPSGPLWDAYQPHQVDGQLLRIGYQLSAPVPTDEPSNERAALTCLEPAVLLCGNN